MTGSYKNITKMARSLDQIGKISDSVAGGMPSTKRNNISTLNLIFHCSATANVVFWYRYTYVYTATWMSANVKFLSTPFRRDEQ